jgi:hypothetical protein
MKGVVFNLLEQVVVKKYGEAVWEELLDATQLTGAYTTLGSYPDDEIEKLVGAASATLQVPPSEVLRWFGREAMPLLAGYYPAFFSPHKNARSFVVSVNSIIHPEVRKLYTGAGCPHFHFEEAPDGALMMGYNSPRKLCALAHGFVEGAGDHYGQTVAVEHTRCMHKGDSNCVLSIHVH